MGRILIYTLSGDAGCAKAKEILSQHAKKWSGLCIVEINLTDYPRRVKEMKRLSGGKRSVPQIFFNSLHIGVRLVCPCMGWKARDSSGAAGELPIMGATDYHTGD